MYTKPSIKTYSEKDLEILMIAYASSCPGSPAGAYCAAGAPYSQACNTDITYCSASVSYEPDTGGNPCSVGSPYYGGKP